MSEQKTFPYVHITENAVMPQLDAGTQFTDTRVQAMIDEAMRHVHATMNVMLQRLETMDAKINLLDKKVKSGNRNVVARSENIAVLHGNMKLNPLYSLQTGKPIVGFPRTISDLNELSGISIILLGVDGWLMRYI
ncbi:hypothetical protein ACHAQJ_002643 [Trichoderma viride]